MGPYFFRLQCPPGWEVVEWVQWQLEQQMRVQNGIILGSCCVTGGEAKIVKFSDEFMKYSNWPKFGKNAKFSFLVHRIL